MAGLLTRAAFWSLASRAGDLSVVTKSSISAVLISARSRAPKCWRTRTIRYWIVSAEASRFALTYRST